MPCTWDPMLAPWPASSPTSSRSACQFAPRSCLFALTPPAAPSATGVQQGHTASSRQQWHMRCGYVKLPMLLHDGYQQCRERPVQAVGASRRVFELLDREPKQPPAGEATPRGSQGGGEVIFQSVWCACDALQRSRQQHRHGAVAAMWHSALRPCGHGAHVPGVLGTPGPSQAWSGPGPGPGTSGADPSIRPALALRLQMACIEPERGCWPLGDAGGCA